MMTKDSLKIMKSTPDSIKYSIQPAKMAQTNIVASHKVNGGVEIPFPSFQTSDVLDKGTLSPQRISNAIITPFHATPRKVTSPIGYNMGAPGYLLDALTMVNSHMKNQNSQQI
jgi:hypothetical protein